MHHPLRFPIGVYVFLQLLSVYQTPVFGQEMDFNRDIRPILSENCFYCHGQDGNKREAGLRLDVREEAMTGGAFVPGDASRGELVARIDSIDPDIQMPPPKSNRKLTEQQRDRLKQWISQGAQYSKHWAFETPQRPKLPVVQSVDWARNPIDTFVLSKIESHHMAPSPTADRATLIKRLYSDLLGLPPAPEEVDRFIEDDAPDAYEQLVDRLLAHPAYGQRMSLAWLDAARYADSNGFQQDGDTWQWMWRDWVVDAMNQNLPFDRFTLWQLAGDLLPDATTEQKIASGFNRNHLLNGEGGAIAEEQRFVILFDRVDTTSTTWLGLTMACAQCHDHKYDPMTQRDYYSLMDAFNHLPESGVPQYFSSRIRVASPYVELPTEANQAHISRLESQIGELQTALQPLVDATFQGWRLGISADGNPAEGKGLPETVSAILRKPDSERTDEERKSLESNLRKHFDDKILSGLQDKLPNLARVQSLRNELNNYRNDQIPRVMIMSDAQARDTHLLERGEYLKPTEKVTFATPGFLPPLQDNAPRNRLGLAQWLVSDEHPLTARVQVNRMWQHFFGAGIVKTAEDFGVQSEYPLHRNLLDWLAVEFRESGWNVKAMHRLIVTSATYRQSSRSTQELRSQDAENTLFARAARFRMPSLVLRDWVLSASALLENRVGGVPVYPYQPDDIWESLAITKERDFTYPKSTGRDLYRRSLYTFWRRTVSPANMFDASNRQACRVRASQTSTPLHALTILNDPTWVEAARVLAEQSLRAAPNQDDKIRFAFRQLLAREPKPNELSSLRRSLQKQLEIYHQDREAAAKLTGIGESRRDDALDIVTHAAMTNLCLTLMNLDEAMCRE